MRRNRRLVLAFAAAMFLPIPGRADPDGDVTGAIWSFKAVDGAEVEKGQFRVYRKEVFKGKKKVGYIVPKDRDETTMVITDFAKLNGTSVLRRTQAKPPVWEGRLKRKGGTTWHITVEIKDR